MKMMRLKLLLMIIASTVNAKKYQCLNANEAEKDTKRKQCEDISDAISINNQQGKLNGVGAVGSFIQGRAGPSWTMNLYPFSKLNTKSESWEQLDMDFDNGKMGSFLSRKNKDCVWWKGNLIHKDLFPVEDIKDNKGDFERVPLWVKNYFSQWNAGHDRDVWNSDYTLKSRNSKSPRMIKHWDANITGLMNDADPKAFWSNWINGRMPMFSKAHDKIVYEQLKNEACNFKTYKSMAEWVSQGPDLTGSNPCQFTERDWRTVCLNPDFSDYCPNKAVKHEDPTYPRQYVGPNDQNNQLDVGNQVVEVSDNYGALYNSVFGQAFGRGNGDVNTETINRDKNNNTVTEEDHFSYFINDQSYVTGSVKTWREQRLLEGTHPDFFFPFERASKMENWEGRLHGFKWTGENNGFINALRKHKKALIGQSDDIFYQDKACGSFAKTILSTLALLIVILL